MFGDALRFVVKLRLSDEHSGFVLLGGNRIEGVGDLICLRICVILLSGDFIRIQVCMCCQGRALRGYGFRYA